MFRKFLNCITDFILPGCCLHCEAPIDGSPASISSENPEAVKFICAKCYGKLERYNAQHPWKDEAAALGVIDNSMSAYWFREGTEIQTLMHEMKYGKMKSVGRLFGREIGRQILSRNEANWDNIIPVPLHKARLRDRTYNQSEFIAQGVSEVIKAEVLINAVRRVRYTGTQTRLNKQERRENIKEAFAVNQKFKSSIEGRNIILVDDVITTGATILECAKAVKEAGAAKVWVCSAAYAELKNV